MTRVLSLFAFLLLFSASEASACFPRCTQFLAHMFGQQPQPEIEPLIQHQGPNQAIVRQDAPPPPPNNQIQIDLQGGNQGPDLQIAVRDVQPPLQIQRDVQPQRQIDEQHIRRAFNLAFDGQQIADRNYTYRQWKATVQPARPDPDRQDNRGTLLYDYKWSRNHWIEASLDTYGGLRRLNVTYNYDMLASNKVGRELGLVDNEPPGAFLARVFAAFGGPQVEIVRGLWREENREFDLMMGEIRRGASGLQAANSSSIGQFARNFYGFTAAAVGDANDIRTGIFETFFARPNFTEDDFEHSLSDDGADRRDEARGSASNMDDGKEEEKGDF